MFMQQKKPVKQIILTKEQLELVNEYCSNDLHKLKSICIGLIRQKKVAQMEYDELISDAMYTLYISASTYKPTKSCTFNTYLVNAIQKSYTDWTRDRLRAKRCNLLMDSNGHIKKDKNNMPIVIENVYLDAESKENGLISEYIADPTSIEKEVFEDTLNSKILKYLARLPAKQRQVAELIMDGYTEECIKEKLHITTRELNDRLMGMRSYENKSILF